LRTAWIISASAHAAVLIFGLVTLASSKPNQDASDFMPVTIVTADDASHVTTGQQNAPKPLDSPKPLADKSGDPKPIKELAPKIADKPEIKTDAAAAASQSKPEPESKPERKATEKTEKPKDKPKTDQIAEALKKDETKKPPKKQPEFKPDQIAEQLKKNEAKKPPSKFDADQVAALLDKREPQRQVATADTLNDATTLGSPTGHAAQLSVSEMEALKRRLSECWNPPLGIDVNSNVYVVLRTLFKPDGSLASEPAVVADTAAALGPALAESGKRALLACQPFTMLKPEHYDAWKEILIGFNPHDLLGQ
jgi:outer membrane biosynthesis protein TonB